MRIRCKFLILAATITATVSLPLRAEIIYFFGEGAGQQLGSHVAGGIDLNNDQMPDLLVTAPSWDSAGRSFGKVYLLKGSDLSVINSVPGVRPDGTAIGIGKSLDTLGDLDNDGYGEFITGARYWPDGQGGLDNYVSLVYSSADLSEPLYVLHGDSTSVNMGKTVACIGDINKDGVNDFLAGGIGDPTSQINIYDGATGNIIRSFFDYKTGPAAAIPFFGEAAAGVGDLDGDTYPDFVISSPRWDETYIDEGRVQAYSGKTFEILWSDYGDSTGARFGQAVNGAGDVNNDGFPDVIVAAVGHARIISGEDGSLIRRHDFPPSFKPGNTQWCSNVAGILDVNKDGYDDYAFSDEGSNISGQGFGMSGKDGSLLLTFSGGKTDVTTAGDVDGNGTLDVFVGSYRATGYFTFSGRAKLMTYVFPDSECLGEPDFDDDQWNDLCDNCPYSWNDRQEDTDRDGFGDRCTDSAVVNIGTNVSANMEELGVALEFENVTSSGFASIRRGNKGPESDGSFAIMAIDAPRYYTVETTAEYSGYIHIEIPYSRLGLPEEEDALLRLYHYVGSEWVDVTDSNVTNRGRVYGTVSSLSQFVFGAPPLAGCCQATRGNANADAEDKINISDVTYLIEYLFGIPIGPEPFCRDEGNANGDVEDKINIGDITYLMSYLFGIPLGPAPPACP